MGKSSMGEEASAVRNVTAMPLLAALALLLTACGAEKPETAAYAPPEEQRLVIYTSHK